MDKLKSPDLSPRDLQILLIDVGLPEEVVTAVSKSWPEQCSVDLVESIMKLSLDYTFRERMLKDMLILAKEDRDTAREEFKTAWLTFMSEEATQTMSAKIDELEAENTNLQQKISQLESHAASSAAVASISLAKSQMLEMQLQEKLQEVSQLAEQSKNCAECLKLRENLDRFKTENEEFRKTSEAKFNAVSSNAAELKSKLEEAKLNNQRLLDEITAKTSAAESLAENLNYARLQYDEAKCDIKKLEDEIVTLEQAHYEVVQKKADLKREFDDTKAKHEQILKLRDMHIREMQISIDNMAQAERLASKRRRLDSNQNGERLKKLTDENVELVAMVRELKQAAAMNASIMAQSSLREQEILAEKTQLQAKVRDFESNMQYLLNCKQLIFNSQFYKTRVDSLVTRSTQQLQSIIGTHRLDVYQQLLKFIDSLLGTLRQMEADAKVAYEIHSSAEAPSTSSLPNLSKQPKPPREPIFPAPLNLSLPRPQSVAVTSSSGTDVTPPRDEILSADQLTALMLQTARNLIGLKR